MNGFLLVGLGGALGSMARYGAGLVSTRWVGPAFPAGTLAVNLVGSFLMVAVVTVAGRSGLSDDARLFLTTGVMGGLTTYSAFNAETLGMLHERPLVAVGYIALTVVGCLVAGLVGRAVAS
ncbi:MAG: fluoride efflux transporter CrcB [Myxococcaceae bacterium]|nr:fluoride efflux transporter CrcB [Myxococcaceae bacterium]